MLFSVIIPAFNREVLIAATLRSVLAQEYRDFEIIVVDDGSTDKTVEIVAQFGEQVLLFRQSNQGPGPARNLGVKHATGEYLVFLDSDDLWFPWALSTYREVIEKCGHPSFICKAMFEFADEKELHLVRREPLEFEKFADYFESVPRRIFVGAGMALIRRDAFLKVGGFASDSFYGEDVDLAIRFGCEPGFVKIHAPATFAYRQHPHSARSDSARLYEGISHIIDQERRGKYPGGDSRKRMRRVLMTMHTRSGSLDILKSGQKILSWNLYLRTAFWNLRQGRVRYLLAFPFLSVGSKNHRSAVQARTVSHDLDFPQGNPFFSVVIPTYNRSAWLREALDSVFQQEFGDYEVIVVDDGSTDDTSQVLRQYGNHLTILVQGNMGPGLARNFGAQYAKGNYLAFLDSDDVWVPWTLATYARIAREQAWPAFIAGEYFRFTERKEMDRVKKEPLRCAVFSNYIASYKTWSWHGVSSFVVRRSEFCHVGGFSQRWINGEDADLALRMSTSLGFITVKSPVTFGYRDHHEGEMSNFPKTLAGVQHLVQQEISGCYSGGVEKKRERIAIVTRHVRPVVLQSLRLGIKEEAWRLYWATFRWHLALGRWKFLAGFVLRACLNRS
jgi:glycosyltransferase involved in cell wall biosynthesis